MNDKDLYDLLKKWAASHMADDEQLDRLREIIVRSDMGERLSPLTIPADYPLWRRSAVLRFAAISAAAIALLVAAFLLWPLANIPSPQPGSPQQLVSLSIAELHERAKLFHEVERIFNHELRWLASNDTSLQMGIRPVYVDTDADAGPVLVRTVVLQRKNFESPWREVMKTDVLTRSQELVELTQNRGSPNYLTLWAYALPDGKVMVESKILVAGPMEISADMSNLLAPGEPLQVFRLKTKDGECRVFQVVTPLPADKGTTCFTT